MNIKRTKEEKMGNYIVSQDEIVRKIKMMLNNIEGDVKGHIFESASKEIADTYEHFT